MRRIYLDYAATTPTHPDVSKAMRPYLRDFFGNPSSMHSIGQEARVAVEESRDKVASMIGASSEEIVFTGGGTEADNFALKGMAYANDSKKNHIITSSIEHHAVLETCKFLERLGFSVTYLPVDGYGLVDPDDVKRAITEKTLLISVMHANNEVGTVEPIAEIGKIAREAGISFHTDAVQTAGHIPVKVDDLGVDMLAMSAHKLGGPKGVGALYVRKGTRIVSFVHGGEQEKGRRASTENVPGIVGFSKAAEMAQRESGKEAKRLTVLRDKLTNGLMGRIEHVHLNGHPTRRLLNNVNMSVDGVEGEHMLLNLNARGICVSTGSACSSSSSKPSHVLLALGLSHEQARGSIRLSLGRETAERDIDRVLAVLPDVVNELRAMAPSGKGIMAEGTVAGNVLRNALLRYETENHTQMLCRFSHLRCLTCPASGVGKGCLLAKWQLAKRRTRA
ncbi:MAG: cysteine desulfurase NifS [Chloroflexi bacterium]|nr:cysteine desulfurase NifS [Chloroflexota bacterium]